MKNEKTAVAVLFGGCSGEHEVSLQSAAAVLGAIDPALYTAVPVGITKDGRWLRCTGGAKTLANGTWAEGALPCLLSPDRADHGLWVRQADGAWRLERIGIVLPVLHGRGGEDGTVQGLAALAGIPLAGCGTLCSALCMDKDKAHRLAAAAGVETPRGFTVTAADDAGTTAERAAALGLPVFVKPLRAGSSLGVARVQTLAALPAALCTAFAYDDTALVEQAVPGFEVGCAVLGPDAEGRLVLGEVDEIELGGAVAQSAGGSGFFDFTEKYSLANSAIHVPARIPVGAAARVKAAAAAVYRALGCRGFARVDSFLTPDGRVVFNEVNTIPGFTAHSRWPNMMKAAGLGFSEAVARILQNAEAEAL